MKATRSRSRNVSESETWQGELYHGGEGVVISARVDLKNPYKMPFAEYDKFTRLDLGAGNLDGQMDALRQEAIEFKKVLIGQGYDGIVIGGPGKARSMEVVAFSKEQIRQSALPPKQFVAYHGTRHPGLTELREGPGAQNQRVAGIYVTKNRTYAEKYTKIAGVKHPEHVLTLRVTLNNPASSKDLDEMGYGLTGYQARDYLISRGFDGVIDDSMDEVIVFDPKQIVIVR